MMRKAGEEVMCTVGNPPAHCQAGHEGPAPLRGTYVRQSQYLGLSHVEGC